MSTRFLDREGLFIVALGGVALLTLALAGYFLFNPPEASVTVSVPVANSSAAVSPTPSSPAGEATGDGRPAAILSEVLVPGEDGRTALELLEATHRVQIDSDLQVFGSIVLAIDSVRAAPDEYWVYYRDSVPGDRPPEACTTATGETIRWILKRRR
jgi:hypothetical protein